MGKLWNSGFFVESISVAVKLFISQASLALRIREACNKKKVKWVTFIKNIYCMTQFLSLNFSIFNLFLAHLHGNFLYFPYFWQNWVQYVSRWLGHGWFLIGCQCPVSDIRVDDCGSFRGLIQLSFQCWISGTD